MAIPPMSFEIPEDSSGDGRRAAHVKWDGKTIALGTFSAQEAVEKCNRAKALTKKWRTTMVPKPDVEWVKSTLERLNIRVVNDRPGRRKKRSIEDLGESPSTSPSSSQQQKLLNHATNRDQALPNLSSANKYNSLPSDATFHALNQNLSQPFSSMGAEAPGISLERRLSNPLQYGTGPQQQQRGLAGSVLSSLPNPSNVYNINGNAGAFDPTNENQHQRPSMSAGARPNNDANRMVQRPTNTQQQLSNLVFGSNQHYEVLKEHHLNLLKELQETTTLMNMYHSSNNQNIDTIDSGFARNRPQDNVDPYLEQSILLGQNQLYAPPAAQRDSFGLGGNFQGRGLPQLGHGNQYDQLANAARRNSLRAAGNFYSMPALNDSRNIGDNSMLMGGRMDISKDESMRDNVTK
mmetsp:Transcript_14232/g.17970  ORF Transcript_14232/g.17970 Transcript_14232/m.17970 type:complete len:406 (-) Transcript_14232:653-1870(-)|eukprot:CAMPEP_0203659942 /NCGR_PEP_ID=MMETSP0088-20131115/54284_1 /ASSEMBLY_ACC=CAM_ASM_001087 /TAXON_ID=426623 /ORGANISM="Chaetoceros affinis, Strain CCMP159" /LENGTH=405 /DNA_ID=CAMNT_0050522137 /DNA_START=116 /DNA_END=1333 /DNA_ORIENTATION=-